MQLGGALHSKGVLILSGFLAARYAMNSPLSLSANEELGVLIDGFDKKPISTVDDVVQGHRLREHVSCLRQEQLPSWHVRQRPIPKQVSPMS